MSPEPETHPDLESLAEEARKSGGQVVFAVRSEGSWRVTEKKTFPVTENTNKEGGENR